MTDTQFLIILSAILMVSDEARPSNWKKGVVFMLFIMVVTI